jgi:hypothetical protein
MASEYEEFDVSDSPALLRLAEEVNRTGRAHLLKHGQKRLAIVSPALENGKRNPARRPRRRGVLKPDDPFWSIVGIGNSGGPGDVSSNKHKYLAEAYMPKER